MKNQNNTFLTFGRALSLLFNLTNGQLGSHEKTFDLLFRSYHRWRTAEANDCPFATSASQISLITKGIKQPPRKLVYHYAQDNGALLRHDCEDFFRQAIQTHKQEKFFLASIINLVDQSTNLTAEDTEYILQAAQFNTNATCETWFRALYILLLEPTTIQKAC